MTDLINQRKAAIDVINDNPLTIPIYAKDGLPRKYAKGGLPSASDSPREICVKEASNSEIYLGIFWKSYGTIPEADNPNQFSMTHLEYNAAKENGRPRLIFIKDELEENRDTKLKDLLREITDVEGGLWRAKFKTLPHLRDEIISAVEDHLTSGYREYNKRKREEPTRMIFNSAYYKNIITDYTNE